MSAERAHGTYRRYWIDKCRCEACREYQRARVARSRAERLARGELTHGKRSAYDAGCRCDQCRDARREARVRLNEYERHGS